MNKLSIYIVFLVIPFVLYSKLVSANSPAPFGFEWNMTPSELERLGMTKGYESSYGISYKSNSAPAGWGAIRTYEVLYDKKYGGIVKIEGKSDPSADFNYIFNLFRTGFESIKQKYGDPVPSSWGNSGCVSKECMVKEGGYNYRFHKENSYDIEYSFSLQSKNLYGSMRYSPVLYIKYDNPSIKQQKHSVQTTNPF